MRIRRYLAMTMGGCSPSLEVIFDYLPVVKANITPRNYFVITPKMSSFNVLGDPD